MTYTVFRGPGIGSAPTVNTNSTPGLAPQKGSNMELHLGVHPCQGSSLSSPHRGHQKTNRCPSRDRERDDDDDNDPVAGFSEDKEEIETNELVVEDNTISEEN